MKNFRILPAAVISLMAGLAAFAHAQSLQFDKEVYVLEAGETGTVRLGFAAAIPNGLEAYALRVLFPEGVLVATLPDIGIVPELDNDLLAENPAERQVAASFLEVSGFSAPGQPYAGLPFLELTVQVAPGTPPGDYPLSLAIPMPNSFVDSELNVLDDSLVLGEALLRVIPPGLQPWPPGVEPFTGTFVVTFSGKPGVSAVLEESGDLHTWSAVESFTFDQSGLYRYPAELSTAAGARFFRLRHQ